MFFAAFPTLRAPFLNFTLTDLLLVLALLAGLLADRRASADLPGQPTSGTTISAGYAVGVFALLAGLGFSSVLAAPANAESAVIVVQYAVALAIFIPLIFHTSRHVDLTKAAVLGVSASCLIGFALRGSNGLPIIGELQYSTLEKVKEFSRFSAMFGNPNTAAKVIAAFVPVLAMCWLKGRINGYWAAALVALWSWSIFASASVGGLLSYVAACTLTVAVLIVAASNLEHRLRRTVALGLVVAALISPLVIGGTDILPQRFQERVLEQNDGLDSLGSAREKEERAAEAWDFVSEEPLIGVGAGNYAAVVSDLGQVHNTYLLVWAEGGLIAMFGLSFIVAAVTVTTAARAMRARSRLVKGLLLLAVANVAVVAFAMVTNTHMYGREMLVPSAVALGAAWATVRGPQPTPPTDGGSGGRAWRVASSPS